VRCDGLIGRSCGVIHGRIEGSDGNLSRNGAIAPDARQSRAVPDNEGFRLNGNVFAEYF
jgi:hypothetical protein